MIMQVKRSEREPMVDAAFGKYTFGTSAQMHRTKTIIRNRLMLEKEPKKDGKNNNNNN